MSTIVSAPPAPLPPPSSMEPSPRSYPQIAHSNSATPNGRASKSGSSSSPTIMSESRMRVPTPPSQSRNGQIPKVVVKTEPTSPQNSGSRHRPTRLNLAKSNITSAGPGALSARPSAGPLTSRESAGNLMQDFGFACLSPGFNAQDSAMQAQLERSMSVREQQRKIIEARYKGGKIPADQGDVRSHPSDGLMSGPKTSRHPPPKRKGPPPGLTIMAPAADKFAHERVIQSAPLHQTFTGLNRHPMQPMSRQTPNQPSNLSQTSHLHHVPAQQNVNRLPPIADVFAGELQAVPGTARRSSMYPQHSPTHAPPHGHSHPPLPSPGFAPHAAQASHPPQSAGRPREYASAEEAIQSMTGGREDLVPKVVHYGGHQPPTPPSPPQHAQSQRAHIGLGVSGPHPANAATAEQSHPSSRGSATAGFSQSRRRDRDEYEKDAGSPPLGRGPNLLRHGPFGQGRDSPEAVRRKKERFMALCSEAFDLMHN